MAYSLGFKAEWLGFRFRFLGFRVWGLGFRVWGLGLGFRVSGFRVLGGLGKEFIG